MKKLLAIALVAFSFNASATYWSETYQDGRATRYVDFDSNGKKTNTPTLWTKIEFKNPTDGIELIITKTQFDCTKETYKIITSAAYDKSNNEIGRINNVPEEVVIPDTLVAIDFNVACTLFRK
jgi:hypothetical protein